MSYMKYSVILFFLLFIQSIGAQPLYLTQMYRFDKVTDIEYNADGLILSSIENSVSGLRESTIYTYDNLGYLIKKEENRSCFNSTGMSTIQIDYENDELGRVIFERQTYWSCEQEESHIGVINYAYSSSGCLLDYRPNLVDATLGKRRFEYERTEDCLILSETISYLISNTVDEYEFTTKTTHAYDDEKRIIETGFFDWSDAQNDFVLETKEKFSYAEHADWIKKETYDEANTLIFQEFKEYDEGLRLINHVRENFTSVPVFETIYESETTYDENDFLISQDFTEYREDGNRTSSATYENFCNGLVYKFERENNYSSRKFLRVTDEYDIIEDCDTENYEIEMLIFPNPSEGFFSVQSNLLELPNNKVELYDVTGRLLFSQKSDSATHQVTIQLNDLVKGIYFLHVSGGELDTVEKIFVN